MIKYIKKIIQMFFSKFGYAIVTKGRLSTLIKKSAASASASVGPSPDDGVQGMMKWMEGYTEIGGRDAFSLCSEFASKARLLSLRENERWESVRLMDVYSLRDYVSDKTVALVANSQGLFGQGKGEEIDDHDIVVRFNSFAFKPGDTGNRTVVHASIHKWAWNFEIPVFLRIIFSGNINLWRQNILKNVKPEAQKYLADRTLAWPKTLYSDAWESDAKFIPTTGFNMLRLLCLFGTSRSIRLYGFDGYKTKPFRIPLVTAKVDEIHNYQYEQKWIEGHSREIGSCVREIIMPHR